MSYETKGRISSFATYAAILIALGFVAFIELVPAPAIERHYANQKLEGWEQRTAEVTAVEPVFGGARGGGLFTGPQLEALRPATYAVPGVGPRRVIVDAGVVEGNTATAWYKPSTGDVKLTADARLSSCDLPDNTGGCGTFGDFMQVLIRSIVPGLGVLPAGFLAYWLINGALLAVFGAGRRKSLSHT